MSLNKLSDEKTGFDLKLNLGCDVLKCNSLEVVEEVKQDGNPVYFTSYARQTGNWILTNGATTAGPTTQEYRYIRSGNYLRCIDNITINTPSSGTTFDMTFDLPDFVDNNLNGVMTMATGRKTDGTGYTLIKYGSSTNGATKKKTISIAKIDGSAFTQLDAINVSFDVNLDLAQLP